MGISKATAMVAVSPGIAPINKPYKLEQIITIKTCQSSSRSRPADTTEESNIFISLEGKQSYRQRNQQTFGKNQINNYRSAD